MEPVGIGTFTDLFKPTRAPHFAILLVNLICLFLVFKRDSGFIIAPIIILLILFFSFASVLSRANFDLDGYVRAFVIGRTALVIGSILSLTILSQFTELRSTASSKYVFGYYKFSIVYGICLSGLLISLVWLSMKPRSFTSVTDRFNFLQSSTVLATLLLSIVFFGQGVSSNQIVDISEMPLYLIDFIVSLGDKFRNGGKISDLEIFIVLVNSAIFVFLALVVRSVECLTFGRARYRGDQMD